MAGHRSIGEGAALMLVCAVVAALAIQSLLDGRAGARAEHVPAGVPAASEGLGACAELAGAGERTATSSATVRSVAQGRSLSEGSTEASIVLATGPDTLGALVGAGDPQQVAAVDLTSDVLVGLFVGRRPRGGYGVTIEKVVPTATGACVIARLTAPSPGSDAIDVETYPYHVIAVPRDQVPLTPGTVWTAISQDGAPIAETVVP